LRLSPVVEIDQDLFAVDALFGRHWRDSRDIDEID
jgi:hypothetical protein